MISSLVGVNLPNEILLWYVLTPTKRIIALTPTKGVHNLFNEPWTLIVTFKTMLYCKIIGRQRKKCIKEMYKILKTEILETRRRNALWKQSMPYFVSWQNQKVTYEKYVGEKWKIHKTEWTEIRGWEATFERVAFHISRGSTQWAGGTQGEPVLGRSSFHRHGHQYHINHADYYKNNKWWALNMMLFATVTSSRMKNYFSGCYCRPPSSSPRRRAPPCACNLPLIDVAMVTLSWCLLVSADAVLSESQVHCKTQDLHHLHASHYGDGRRCPIVTLSFMFLSNPCFQLAAT